LSSIPNIYYTSSLDPLYTPPFPLIFPLSTLLISPHNLSPQRHSPKRFPQTTFKMTSAEIQRIIVIVGSTLTSISTTFFIYMCIRSCRKAKRRIEDEERPRLILICEEDERRTRVASDARRVREEQRQLELLDIFNFDRVTIAPTVLSDDDDPDSQPICSMDIPKAKQTPSRDCSPKYMTECRDDNHAHLRNTDDVKYCVTRLCRADFRADPPTPPPSSPVAHIAPWMDTPKAKHRPIRKCKDKKHPHVKDPMGTKYCVLEVRKAIYRPMEGPALPDTLPPPEVMEGPAMADTPPPPEDMEGPAVPDTPPPPEVMDGPAMPAPVARLLKNTVLGNMDDEDTDPEERTKTWVDQYADPTVGRPDSTLIDPQTLAQYKMEPVAP
jgi:hypothetical protein